MLYAVQLNNMDCKILCSQADSF